MEDEPGEAEDAAAITMRWKRTFRTSISIPLCCNCEDELSPRS